MSLKNRPPKGTPASTTWLWGAPTRKRVQGEPVNQTSPSNVPQPVQSQHRIDHANHLTVFQLPDEIFLKVFSNFPTFQLEHAYHRIDQHGRSVADTRYFGREYGARHRVLVVFVQLCRSTRQKFLPWLWEHVQSLCVYPSSPERLECRRLAETMFRKQYRTLIAMPSLGVYVKCVPPYLIVPRVLA